MAAFTFPPRLIKIHATPKPTAGGLELGVSTTDVTERFEGLFEGIDALESKVNEQSGRSSYGGTISVDGDTLRAVFANAKALRASVYDRADLHDD